MVLRSQYHLLNALRHVRRRAGTPARTVLEEASLFSDVNSVILNPTTRLPYPDAQVQEHVEQTSKELLRERNKIRFGRKKISNFMIFDHIPIENQIVLLFPGQGSQFVGMAKNVLNQGAATSIFEESSEYLGYDLKKLCLEGPATKLDQTLYCQPAVFVSSLAAFEMLKSLEPGCLDKITDIAGFSVGEYAALVAGGILSFTDALKLVTVRAEAMHECSQLIKSGMLTIRVNASSKLEEAMNEAKNIARDAGEREICDIANYLFCGVRVVGASETCMRFLEENQTTFKFQVVKRLAVSGAFHTKLMEDAVHEIRATLAAVEINRPSCNVYSNYTGHVYSHKKGEVRSSIIKQVTHPVKWEQIQQLLYRKHQDFKFPRFIEVGPGRQLGSMLLHTSKKAFQHYEHVF